MLVASCSEPSVPCGSLNLSGDHPRSSVDDEATVVAVSHGDADGKVTILRACTDPAACPAELVEQTLILGKPPEQILLTGSGRWLTYVIGGALFWLDLENLNPSDPQPDSDGGPNDVRELVAALRGGEWIIYRTVSDELWAYYVGDDESGLRLDEQGRPNRYVRIGTNLERRPRLVSVGHRHVIVGNALGNGDENLYLVRIAPARKHDEFGSFNIGKAELLASGPEFTRVLVTSGATPEQLDLPDPFPEVPIDELLIASSGSGSQARTLIFDIGTLDRLDNFPGAVATSTIPLYDLPGLSAVSPSGTHLAYVTQGGALELHDLESQTSCMVRPADNAEHTVAGFGSDGILYFQSSERALIEVRGEVKRTEAVKRVFAYDTRSLEFTPLTSDDRHWALVAVPAQTLDERPWAVVSAQGKAAARLGELPHWLGYADDVTFLPRGDESLWVLEVESASSSKSTLRLRRFLPTDKGSLAFDDEHADPSVFHPFHPRPTGITKQRFELSYGTSKKLINKSLCVSVSQAASLTTPWATRCSTPKDPARYLENKLPPLDYDD